MICVLAGSNGSDLKEICKLRTLSMRHLHQKLDEQGLPMGITPRLTEEFGEIIDNNVKELENMFKEGLEEKCQIGATQVCLDSLRGK